MASPPSILASFLLFALAIYAQKDNGQECSCFRTNTSSSAYFAYHRFHDFRNIASAGSPPDLVSNESNVSSALPTSDFFVDQAWQNDWNIVNWNNSDTMGASGDPVLMINSPNNVYIEKSNDSDPSYSSYLTLRTARLPDFQTAGEIDSVEQNYQFLSLRLMARIIGSPGACAGIFTYLPNNDPQKIQEADIEILTKDPRNAVQYTNQPSNDKNGDPVTQATVNASDSSNRLWTLWNTYRVDWTPGLTTWYVNGEPAASIAFQAPKDPTGIIMNMWGDGGLWTGPMQIYDEAFLQIQWIEIVYNTSGPYLGADARKRDALEERKVSKCQAVCSVDDQVNVTGTPVLLYNNTGMAQRLRYEGLAGLGWIPVTLVAGAVYGML